jgi:integrase
MKLTQKIADALTLPAGRTEIIAFDDGLPGFGLRVRATGGRSWIYQYKVGPRQRRVTLGNAHAVKLEQARAIAANLHAQVRLGHDVAAERDARRAKVAETFGAAIAAYLPRLQARVRPRSYVETGRYLSRYLRSLHDWQLAAINRRAVAERLLQIETAHGRASANRARTCLSAFFSWAMREGLADANPVIGTERRKECSRSRVLSESELRTIWSALGSDEFGAIVRLLILTGQRREEIGGLRWSEIEVGAIRLPAERVKNKREHTVPLSAPARAILARPHRFGHDFVFGRGEGGFSGWSRCKGRLDVLITGLVGHPLPGWTLHDIRRSVVTGMADIGIQPHVIEAVINHISGTRGGIAGVYNRSSYQTEKRRALELWAEHLLKVIEGADRKVVPLHA